MFLPANRYPLRRNMRSATSREQNRRQPLAPRDRRLVGRTPGLEELDRLLARAVVVPFAVALDDLEEVVDRRLALSLAVQRHREVEARLVIERVGGDLLLELGDRPDRFRLLEQVERRACRRHRGVVAL